MFEHDFMRDECGVFGISAPGEDVSRLTFFGLFALQHRGQESAGIAVSDGETISCEKKMGLAQNVFDEETLGELEGMCAVGHVRYSTTGASILSNAQPMVVDSRAGQIALAHNGNLVNAAELREELEVRGEVFESTSDSEVIVRLLGALMGSPGGGNDGLEGALSETMGSLMGAYSAVLVHKDALVGMRDPWGIRPLCMGRLNDGALVIASETCALSVVGARVEREIEPGEVVIARNGEVHSLRGQSRPPGVAGSRDPDSPLARSGGAGSAFCIFEYVYLGRPDSVMLGRNLDMTRRRMGHLLAQEKPVRGDVVVPVPNTGIPAAIGYSEASRIPLSMGLIKNQYIQRTFIQPDQRMRDMGVRMKLSAIPDLVAGRRVILVDDSIVRGTTTGHLVRMVRESGAREVHLRICSPPIGYPCYYGVDTAIQEDLIAYRMKVPEIKEAVGADSLGYLSIKGLVRAIDLPRSQLCLACLNGRYPIGVPADVKIHRAMFESGSDEA